MNKYHLDILNNVIGVNLRHQLDEEEDLRREIYFNRVCNNYDTSHSFTADIDGETRNILGLTDSVIVYKDGNGTDMGIPHVGAAIDLTEPVEKVERIFDMTTIWGQLLSVDHGNLGFVYSEYHTNRILVDWLHSMKKTNPIVRRSEKYTDEFVTAYAFLLIGKTELRKYLKYTLQQFANVEDIYCKNYKPRWDKSLVSKDTDTFPWLLKIIQYLTSLTESKCVGVYGNIGKTRADRRKNKKRVNRQIAHWYTRGQFRGALRKVVFEANGCKYVAFFTNADRYTPSDFCKNFDRLILRSEYIIRRYEKPFLINGSLMFVN